MRTAIQAQNQFRKIFGYELTDDELGDIAEIICSGSDKFQLMKWEPGQEVAMYEVTWRQYTFYACFHLLELKIVSFMSLTEDIYLDNGDLWKRNK